MKIFAVAFVLAAVSLLPCAASAQTTSVLAQAQDTTTAGTQKSADKSLVAVPEPSAWLLALGGVGVFALMRRRKA